MKIKRIFAALAAAAMLCGVTGCSSDIAGEAAVTFAEPGVLRGADNINIKKLSSRSAEDSEKIFKVGIAKLMDHPALDLSEEGFVAALTDAGFVIGENLILEYRNGNNDESALNAIAEEFVADNYDLIFAIATPAAQACAKKTTEIPIIGTAITDFVDAGLIESNARPASNVSGATDMSPVDEQIAMIRDIFPEVKTVGFVYTASESNSALQIGIAKKQAEQMGLATVEVTVNSKDDIETAFADIVTKCDAIYLPTDNLLASEMPRVAAVCNPAKIPVFCAEGNMVEAGGFGTLALDYYDLGYTAGTMAVKVIDGASIDRMAIQKSSKFEYSFNTATVAALDVTLPEEYQRYLN